MVAAVEEEAETEEVEGPPTVSLEEVNLVQAVKLGPRTEDPATLQTHHLQRVTTIIGTETKVGFVLHHSLVH